MPHDSPLAITVFVAAGLFAGFVNTLAGAGSLVSLRALMLFGLPADVANATNRVPVLAQSLAAAHGFAGAGALERGQLVRVMWPPLLGSGAGALAASYAPEAIMRWVLIVVLFGIGVMGLVSVRKKSAALASEPTPEEIAASLAKPATVAWLFVAGAYGGFLQAGVGLVLLHALSSVGKLDLVRANALKVVIVAVFTVLSLAIFVWRDQVVWMPAAVMSVGSVVGARLAVRFASLDKKRLQVAVVVIDAVACIVLAARELWG